MKSTIVKPRETLKFLNPGLYLQNPSPILLRHGRPGRFRNARMSCRLGFGILSYCLPSNHPNPKNTSLKSSMSPTRAGITARAEQQQEPQSLRSDPKSDSESRAEKRHRMATHTSSCFYCGGVGGGGRVARNFRARGLTANFYYKSISS